MRLLTQRFPTVVGILLLMLAAAGGWWWFSTNKPQVKTEIVPNNVRITNVADNKFTVSWTTKTATVGEVEYGTVGAKLTAKANDERDEGSVRGTYTTHYITVSNLQPNTQYAFRILSGEKGTRFDNNGTPYNVATGPVIGTTPTAKSFYGDVAGAETATGGIIAYVSVPGGAPASTLVKSTGSYALTLSTVRSADLKSYVTYDPAATIVSVILESGIKQSNATVSLANAAPVPTITLGQDADFRNPGITPNVAEVTPASSSAAPVAETPTIFNVEPLTSEEGEINVVTTNAVKILNPSEDGEVITALRPEMRGTGPKGTALSITLQSTKSYSGTAVIATDGTWSWSPASNLVQGSYNMTVAYVDAEGEEQAVFRSFAIGAASSGDPAFVASTSASVKPTASVGASMAGIPRAGMPATDSGVPVTGVMTPTLLTAGLGFVIMVLGALLLAF